MLAGGARAADWYTGVPTDGPVRPAAPTVAIDLAIDGTSQKAVSGALIGTIAPFAPLDRTGMRVRVAGLGGVYNYFSPTPGPGRVNGQMQQVAVLAGYEWVWKKMTIAGFGGVEFRNSSISPNDPNNRVKGATVGLKVGVDFYVTPTDTTMVSGVAYYSTNFNSYYGRPKFGMAFADHLYVGPEVLALGDDFFQQWRVGAHVSGMRLGFVQMGVSGGFLSDRVRGTGLYGIFESRVTF
jgi:hypothetical protein